MQHEKHIHYMRSALSMARRGIGFTAPNPSVGCVIVKDGQVLAMARTADGGRPHAETIALEKAGKDAEAATLYVTLEPCTHHGQTPPCVDAIINAKVKKVVIGATDIDPRVAGKAKDILESAGVHVIQDVLKQECERVNNGFFSNINKKKPFVKIKSALTLDGKVACASGESHWVTGEQARRHGHFLRSQSDAILVGSGTAINDDPMLTTRLKGLDHTIIRIVLDRELSLSPKSQLMKTAKLHPLWIFCEDAAQSEVLEKAGARVFALKKLKLEAVLTELAQNGVNNLLVEGGATIHSEFIKQGLVDELHLYRAPTLLGDQHKGMASDIGVESLVDRHDFVLQEIRVLGADCLEIYRKI
ncbi:MAG: bifunctional diaminohydroxyphosphoribosylaminopyrimidine deaminase/5-amino-6-(5-phosphoribosylamino)uracil reductase RibD [Alphaproteobacteria bacterium]|nr:bifunctional diaminohydroxyphosphoribosylaminopyrimidine deaminase/5-amino-6-(5-phosphoribosylamino)uracil reductase RibD [Alphaproteobacteria bacterium]